MANVMTMATSRSTALKLLPKSATARGAIGRRPIASARVHLPTGRTQTRSIGYQSHPFLARTHPLLSCTPSSTQSFHSHDHPPPEGSFGTTETAILSAAYKHVPEHGFSTASIALGARDAGLPDISTSVLPDGEFGLIRWHLVTQQNSLATKARELFGSGDNNGEAGQGTAGERYTIPEKVEMLLWKRLMGNADIVGHWQQALAIMAHPTYVPASLRHLAQLADEIVFLAGDKAVDPSWYTSRAGVSAIYASCELFMTSDNSEGFQETRQFLRRRMQEASAAKGFLGGIGQWIGFQAMGAVNVARSLGMRV